jgi:hypothetical protein
MTVLVLNRPRLSTACQGCGAGAGFVWVTGLVTTRWSRRAAASVGVAGAGPPHTVLGR